MRVEWDAAKSLVNRRKHRLSFEEAAELFTSGAEYLEIYDETHSADEDRFIAVGRIRRGIVVVAYAEPADDVVRVVSARMATGRERRRYREAKEGNPRR